MFRKRRSEESTIIGRGAYFKGTIEVLGPLRVNGDLEGEVVSEASVSIGPEGKVLGSLRAQDVEVAGLIQGTVTTSGCLHMAATGRVDGDAYYETLQVDCGGVIDGRARCVVATDDALPEPIRFDGTEFDDDDDDDDEIERVSEPVSHSHPPGAVHLSTSGGDSFTDADQSVELLQSAEFTELPDLREEVDS